MKHLFSLMHQPVGLHSHKLPTKTTSDQKKSFHFQRTWIIFTVSLFYMPQKLGMVPYLFLFSFFLIDRSSVFLQTQAVRRAAVEPVATRLFFNHRSKAFPQGWSPLEKGKKNPQHINIYPYSLAAGRISISFSRSINAAERGKKIPSHDSGKNIGSLQCQWKSCASRIHLRVKHGASAVLGKPAVHFLGWYLGWAPPLRSHWQSKDQPRVDSTRLV